jgi:hypothetical protein
MTNDKVQTKARRTKDEQRPAIPKLCTLYFVIRTSYFILSDIQKKVNLLYLCIIKISINGNTNPYRGEKV